MECVDGVVSPRTSNVATLAYTGQQPVSPLACPSKLRSVHAPTHFPRDAPSDAHGSCSTLGASPLIHEDGIALTTVFDGCSRMDSVTCTILDYALVRLRLIWVPRTLDYGSERKATVRSRSRADRRTKVLWITFTSLYKFRCLRFLCYRCYRSSLLWLHDILHSQQTIYWTDSFPIFESHLISYNVATTRLKSDSYSSARWLVIDSVRTERFITRILRFFRILWFRRNRRIYNRDLCERVWIESCWNEFAHNIHFNLYWRFQFSLYISCLHWSCFTKYPCLPICFWSFALLVRTTAIYRRQYNNSLRKPSSHKPLQEHKTPFVKD